jgi:5-methylcytosine-specific restriction endonuclease McrA
MAHTYIYKACEHCNEQFTMKGRQTVARQKKARFCSVACRSASGRRDVTCKHCGMVFSRKASEAADRHFCSRKCMFAEWGCAVCSKIRPEERRMAGDTHCSDRCALTSQLEELARETGELFAVCRRCKHILPAERFTKERKHRNGLSHDCKDCSRAYYEENKGAYQRRRYQYQAAPGGIMIDFTPAQKAARFALWGGHCWMCGIADATEEDHVKPISTGGSHCLSNLRPICKRCNTTKRGAWPLPAESLRANFRHPSPREGSARDEVTERQPRVHWTCPQCGKTDLIRAHVARTRKYCSQECVFKSRISTTVDKVCLNPLCAKTFTLPGGKGAKGRKFCSIECAWVARDRPAHWRDVSEGQLTLF